MLPTKPLKVPMGIEPKGFDRGWDIPDTITRHMGHRQFFFECGAKSIHRIGTLLGLGWRLPVGESRDFIDWVRITVETAGHGILGPRYTIQFGKGSGMDNVDDAPIFNLIREFGGVKGEELRAVYDRETGVSE